MARGNPNWRKDKIVDWRYRIRGKSPDGRTVTLGKFTEKKEATLRYNELVQEGRYGRLRIEPLKPRVADSSSIASPL
jgi:hypothetical protein